LSVLDFQPALTQRVAHGQHGLLDRQGLFDEVERAELGGADGSFHARVAGNHDHSGLGAPLAQPLERGKAVYARQPDIQQDHIRRLPDDLFETRLTALGGVHRVAFIAQNGTERRPDARFIVDNQDA